MGSHSGYLSYVTCSDDAIFVLAANKRISLEITSLWGLEFDISIDLKQGWTTRCPRAAKHDSESMQKKRQIWKDVIQSVAQPRIEDSWRTEQNRLSLPVEYKTDALHNFYFIIINRDRKSLFYCHSIEQYCNNIVINFITIFFGVITVAF